MGPANELFSTLRHHRATVFLVETKSASPDLEKERQRPLHCFLEIYLDTVVPLCATDDVDR